LRGRSFSFGSRFAHIRRSAAASRELPLGAAGLGFAVRVVRWVVWFGVGTEGDVVERPVRLAPVPASGVVVGFCACVSDVRFGVGAAPPVPVTLEPGPGSGVAVVACGASAVLAGAAAVADAPLATAAPDEPCEAVPPPHPHSTATIVAPKTRHPVSRVSARWRMSLANRRG
jgi:hypothetical protein